MHRVISNLHFPCVISGSYALNKHDAKEMKFKEMYKSDEYIGTQVYIGVPGTQLRVG